MKTLRYMCPNKDTTLTFISSLCKAVLYKNCGELKLSTCEILVPNMYVLFRRR